MCYKSAVLILFSTFLGGALQAQSYIKPVKKDKKLSLGFDVSFGTRLFQVQSNVDAINKMNVLEEGGTAGIVFGSNLAQVKLRQGYFYSASSVRYTTDLIETSFEIDINPLQLGRSRWKRCEPYLLAGVARDAIKFHGHYLDVSGVTSAYGEGRGSQKPNYSHSEMPYLGTVVSARLEGGLGMTYRVNVMGSFLRFFGEARYGYSVGHSATPQFENTSSAHQLSLSLGTSFGWKL
jgi:hypothetical protein